MTPHERAADFVASYLKITEQDSDISNFQRVLEMKVSGISNLAHLSFLVGTEA